MMISPTGKPLLLDRNELQGLWVGTLNCRALCALALVALGHDAFRETRVFRRDLVPPGQNGSAQTTDS